MSAFAEQHIATDTGRVRTQNEDAVWMNDRILAVADGMGGHSRGEVASRIAIETVTEYADVLTNSSADPDEMREAVDAVFQLASERIEAEAAGAQMGTTLVFAVLAPNGSTVYIAHAGDSRAYLKRRGLLRTLTRDHNVYNLLIERGMDEQEAANHPHREKLTQGLGFGFVEPDLAVVELTGDDTVLLCSDGLCGYVDESRIRAEMEGDAAEIARRLIEATLAEGAPDNVTVAIARVNAHGTDAGALDQRLSRLASLALFRELSEADLRNVSTYLRTNRFREGDVLITEGEEGHECIVIIQGTADITRGDIPLAQVGAGQHMGELALTGPWTRSATVRATSHVLTVHFTREQFDRLSAARPDIGMKISRALATNAAERIVDLTGRIEAADRALRGQ